MESAGASYTSGKDLCSLSHALSELCDVLIIDSLDPVRTEHTNLLAGLLRGAGISFLFHDFSSYRNKVKLTISERNIAVAEDLFKVTQRAV